MQPLVTVLMPVYNGQSYLREAIQSILEQTYINFELLIMDDGSTDQSAEIVKSYRDKRIKLYQSEKNEGISKTLNKGIKLSRGQYIARMDSDDISHPDRFMHQVTFLEEHPEIGVLGSGIENLKDNRTGKKKQWPESDAEIKINLLFQNPFFHSTVMVRRSLMNDIRYPENMRYAQDFGLWVSLAPCTHFANLLNAMVQYRTHSGQITKTKANEQRNNARMIREVYLKSLFPECTENEMILHHRISERNRQIDLSATALWFEKILLINNEHNIFPDIILRKILARKWWNCCKNSTHSGLYIWKKYRQCVLSKVKTDEPKNMIKYVIKIIFRKPSHTLS